MNSKKKPVSAELLERFMHDKDTLFVDYIDAGENIGQLELSEEKIKWKDTNKNQCSLQSRSDLLAKYKKPDGTPDHNTVNKIIARKTQDGLFEEDDDMPDSEEHRLYYCRKKTTFTASNSSSRVLTLSGKSTVGKDAVKRLTGKDGVFGEDPEGTTKVTFKPAAAATPKVSSASAAEASTAVKEAGEKAGPPVRMPQTGLEKNSRKAGKLGAKKSKQMQPQTPAERAKDMAIKCLEDSSKARTLSEKLHGVKLAESITQSLRGHCDCFTERYHTLMALVQTGGEEEACFAAVFAEVVLRRQGFKADMDFASTVCTGIHKPKAKKKGTPKAKCAKSS